MFNELFFTLRQESWDMVNKCSAINCRSGYARERKDPSVTFHAFPLRNKQLLQIWLNLLDREGFTPTKYSRLCSLHFKAEDFIEDSTDQKSRRRNKKKSSKLLKRRLQKNACPSIFKDIPAHLLPRRSVSDSKSRRENKAARLEERFETLLKTDIVKNFKDVVIKLDKDVQRQGYIMQQTQLGVNLVYLTKECPPSILATISVKKNLEVTVFCGPQVVPASTYTHILSSNKVTLLSQISRLMAFAKNFQITKAMLQESLISKLIGLVHDFLKISDDDQEIGFRQLLSEQLELMLQNNSTDLKMLSYVIYSILQAHEHTKGS